MKPKNGKDARPRFHVYFPIHVISDADAYAALKRKIYDAFPFFDSNALDAARFLYGSPGSEVLWHEGSLFIEDYLTLSAKASIPQGKRNATMSHYAGRILKRLGLTDKAYKKFLEKAEECDPPLDQEELDKIWASACKFYKKIAASPDYIPPDEYTGDSLKPDDFSDIGEARTFAAVYEGEVCYTEATGFLRNNEIYWMESRQRPIAAMMEHTDAQLEEAGDLIEGALDRLEDLGISRGLAMAGGKKLLEGMTSEQVAVYSEYVNAKSYYAFVMKCRNMKGLKAAMEAAMPLLEKQPDELDSNPFLLNTPTATYNLTEGLTGTKEHDPEDYITKVTTVSPDDVGADIWQDSRKVIAEGFNIKPPKVVRDAVAAYREDNDWLGRFLDENCVMDSSYQEKSGDLYKAYRSYCINMHEYTRSTGDFYAALEQAGYHKQRTNKGVVVYGLMLKSDEFSEEYPDFLN